MSSQIKLRRGTTAQHSTFTGAEAEVTVDTDKETLVVHDGSTAGGHEVMKADASNYDGSTIASFRSTGIDDNATSTALTINSTGIDVTGTVTADGLTNETTNASPGAVFTKNRAITSVSGNTDAFPHALQIINGDTTTNTNLVSIGFSVYTSGSISNAVLAGQSTSPGNMDLTFHTESGNTIGERMRIDSSGNVELKTTNANLILPTGGGISFENHSVSGATGASSTTSDNVLDDYEEGTWTPTIVTGGLTISSIPNATYTKIGRYVMCNAYVNLTGTGNTDPFKMGGLPINSQVNGFSPNIADFGKGAKKGAYSRVNSSSTEFEFLYSSENTSVDRGALNGNEVGTGYLILQISYMAS